MESILSSAAERKHLQFVRSLHRTTLATPNVVATPSARAFVSAFIAEHPQFASERRQLLDRARRTLRIFAAELWDEKQPKALAR
jgi:hypothetical protein